MFTRLPNTLSSICRCNMVKLTFPVALIQVLCHAMTMYVEILPNRMQKIRKFLSEQSIERPAILQSPFCEVCLQNKLINYLILFDPNYCIPEKPSLIKSFCEFPRLISVVRN